MKFNCLLSFCLLLMLSATAYAGSITLKDPSGDDNGPGEYIYPTDGVYTKGSFDLKTLDVNYTDKKVNFAVSMNAGLDDPWGMQTGFAIQMIYIFIDTDGKPGSGYMQGTPGLNIMFAPQSAWDKVVILSPQQKQRVKSEINDKAAGMSADILVPTGTKGSGKTISGSVKRDELGDGDPSSWGFQVVVQSNEGFPASTDLLTRKVNEYEGQHRFGGGNDGECDPHVIDILAGDADGSLDEVEAQHQMLAFECGEEGSSVTRATLTMIRHGESASSMKNATAPSPPSRPAASTGQPVRVNQPMAPSGPLQKLKWGGTIYTKWLDGDRVTSDGLYSNSEFGNGDQGQGTEFEILFEAKVSKQVEIGGRIKARFNRNWWSNGGGFSDDELDPRSAQYMKFRGAYVKMTPGYKWIDSSTIGSNDWGQFDAFTMGKSRYIDRDNISGLLFQGSAGEGKAVRWDVARVSLPKLWAGPGYNTGELHQADAAYVGQLKWNASDLLNVTAIYEHIKDYELDPADGDNRDGNDLTNRYRNQVGGLKIKFSKGNVDVKGSYYHSKFTPGIAVDNSARFTPTLRGKADDDIFKLNVDISDLGPFTVSVEYFDIGASYMSMMAARRESDVLLTEGYDGSWGWSRPDYNRGDNSRGSSRAGVGYGGWDGASHQVVSLNADNDFTDFDESMAYSVLGWKGLTVVPKLTVADWEISAELSLIDYNSNWQGNVGVDNDGDGVDDALLHPVVDGVHSWGVGGDTRSPYANYQEKETSIFLIKAEHVFDVGEGLEFKGKFKLISDEDERVTGEADLADAYTLSLVEHVNYDDREADYTSYGISLGYQLFSDLHVSLDLEHYEVDLFDGTIDVTPPNMEAWEPEFGWINYMTGQHDKDKLALRLKYFLSGLEFGLNTQWIEGTYDPEFYNGVGGGIERINPATSSVATPLGEISTATVEFEHYRLKAFMKVQF